MGGDDLVRLLGMMLLVVAAALLLVTPPGWAQNAATSSFDHAGTGFPLTGTHVSVSCAACHVNGRMKNTPTQCIGCHNTMTAPGLPQSHPRTTFRCDACHLTTTWRDFAFMDHAQATGPCASCHNNKFAIGKNSGHVVTNAPCNDCHHNTVSFAGATATGNGTTAAPAAASPATMPAAKPASPVPPSTTQAGTTTPAGMTTQRSATTPAGMATQPSATTPAGMATQPSTTTQAAMTMQPMTMQPKMSHVGVVNRCAMCHNGVTAGGKPPNHVVSNAPCETCHKSTVTFAGAAMNHAGIVGNCASCHNSGAAIGKPAKHIVTNAACESCHRSTVTFEGARVDHASITATCASCHNGATSEGKPPRHFVTTLPCDTCHRTVAWIPANYRHVSPAYVNHGPSVACASCHSANAQVVAWKFPAFRPGCAGCHVDKFRPTSHPKLERPVKVYYTVAELRDCTGACHVYSDYTQRTILTRQFGRHRSAGGGW